MFPLLKKLKPSPAFIEAYLKTGGAGVESLVEFAYLDKDDRKNNKEDVIASELELAVKFKKSETPDVETLYQNWGILGKYENASRFNKSKEEFYTTPLLLRQSVIRAFVNAIGPNTSTLISDSKVDATIAGDDGGVEIVYTPITLLGLKHLKPDIERLLHYAKLSYCTSATDDTSIHFHINMSFLGKDAVEQESTVANMLWFLFDNHEWMREFSGRQGEGEDLANLRYFLGDVSGLYTIQGLKKKFINTKASILEFIREGKPIGREIRDVDISHDDRIKGYFNMVINDKYNTLEFRWFGSTTETEVYMTRYEFTFAWVYAAKGGYLLGNSEVSSMDKFLEYVQNNKMLYPHLYNSLFEKDKIEIEANFTTEQLLDFHPGVEYIYTERIDAVVEAAIEITPDPIVPTEVENDAVEEIAEEPAEAVEIEVETNSDEIEEPYEEEYEEEVDEIDEFEHVPKREALADYDSAYADYLSDNNFTKRPNVFCGSCEKAFKSKSVAWRGLQFNLSFRGLKQKFEPDCLCTTCLNQSIKKDLVEIPSETFCPIQLEEVDSSDFVGEIAGFHSISADAAITLLDLNLLNEVDTKKVERELC